MKYHDNIRRLIAAPQMIQDEFVKEIAKPIYGYNGSSKSILFNMLTAPDYMISDEMQTVIDNFVRKHNLVDMAVVRGYI